MSLAEAAVLLTSGSEASHFTVLVDGIAYPVHSGVPTNSFVVGIDTDNLIVFVDGVLSNPVAGMLNFIRI